MTTPRVSVVMPTWNRAPVVGNAIRSIIDQTYEDWELVIVDDGSTDSTEIAVRDFAHPKIRYHKVEHQNNISKVRNIAADLAKGEILVVQDSDDMSFPDRLEKIVECFDKTGADLVYHGMYIRTYDAYRDVMARTVKPSKPFDKDRAIREQYIPGQLAYRKTAWEKTPYNEDVPLCDDFMFIIEQVLVDSKFAQLDLNLYEYIPMVDSANILGEEAGNRLKDAETILAVLKKKYGIDAHATMEKSMYGAVTERKII